MNTTLEKSEPYTASEAVLHLLALVGALAAVVLVLLLSVVLAQRNDLRRQLDDVRARPTIIVVKGGI